MKKYLENFLKLFFLFFVLFVFIACGGGSSSDNPISPNISGGGGTITPDSSCDNISGIWEIAEIVTDTDCPTPAAPIENYYTYSISSDGCNFTLTDPYGKVHSGTSDDQQIEWDESYEEYGGTITKKNELTINGETATGSATWTFNRTEWEPCTGTTQITGTRTGKPVRTPDAPSALAAEATSGSTILLTYTDNADNETGFSIERGSGSCEFFSEIATVSSNVSFFNDSGLMTSTDYCYRVKAYNADGASEYSNPATATTDDPPQSAPTAPTELVAAPVSNSGIQLSWTDTSDNESGFIIERSFDTDKNFEIIGETLPNTQEYSDIGLDSSTTYYYRIKASNSIGGSEYTDFVNATTFESPISPPSPPTNLSAIATSSSMVALNWNDNSSDETGFSVWRSLQQNSGFIQIDTVGANTHSYESIGLNSSTTYYFRVHAYNSAGNSGFSNIVNATTEAPAVTLPSAPTGLSATETSSSAVTLSWEDNSSNETGFSIWRSLQQDSGFTQIDSVGANTLSYDANGLNPSTTYYFRVQAYNSAGDSNCSNTADATTDSNLISYTFTGGNIEDLKSVSPTLEFQDLVIDGALEIESNSSNRTIVFTVETLTVNNRIYVSDPGCKPFYDSPDFFINATGTVSINDSLDFSGKSGDATTSNPICNSCYGENGGNITINAEEIYINDYMATSGGYGAYRHVSSSLYNGCSAGNSGYITLNADIRITIDSSSDFKLQGRDGGSGRGGGADGADGEDGLLTWDAPTIVVYETDRELSNELNSLTNNAKLLSYAPLKIHGNICYKEEEENRLLFGSRNIKFTNGAIDWIEDLFILDVQTSCTVNISLTTSSGYSDLDLYLLPEPNEPGEPIDPTIIGESNGLSSDESISQFVSAGKYMIGVSFADDYSGTIVPTVPYTLTFGD